MLLCSHFQCILKNQTDAFNQLFIFSFKGCRQFWMEHFKEKQRKQLLVIYHQSIITLLIHVMLLLFNREKLLNWKE